MLMVLGQEPLKCQEKPSGVYKMQQTTGTAARPPSWWRGCWLPLPENPTSALGLLGLGLRPFGPRLSPPRIFKLPPK